MNDRTFYDEAIFAELDQPIPLRKQVVEWIDRYCATTGKSHSFAWRKSYLELEGATGFRVPDKKGLDAVEKAGRIPQLLEVVKKLSGDCGGHATEVNNAIPDFVPHVSDRERWKTNGTKACDHEWGVFSTVLEDVTLLVQCVECGAYGKVGDPSADEWQRAFHAPSNPYHWPDGDRVELLPGKEEHPSNRHIVRACQERSSPLVEINHLHWSVMTETEVAAFCAKSLDMRAACDKLIAKNDAIPHAGGELMSAMVNPNAIQRFQLLKDLL